MSTTLLDRSAAPPPAELRPFHFPAIDRFELQNGVPTLFSRTVGPPVVTFSLLLPGGALQESDGQAGLATLTGALLESGTAGMDAAEIARKLEMLGVRVHLGTSWEVAHVDFTVLPERAATAARMISELIREPTFPPVEVARIRNEQMAALLQRRADPRGLANEMASRYIFAPSSPFARPLAGTPETISTLSREAAVEFHRATYTPRGVTLVVAGNVSPELVRETAEAGLGQWTGVEPRDHEGIVLPRTDSVQVILVERPGAVQSEIRVGHVGVPRNTPDFFALTVMNTILGGAFSSRLNLNLREKHGFTYGVSSSFAMRRRPGPFTIATAVQTEVTGRAVAEILLELERIRLDVVTPVELADARQYIAGTFPLRLQTTDGVAACLAELVVHDLPATYFDEFADRILAVTAEEVRDVAFRHVRPEQAVILVVGDPEKVRPQLASLGVGEVTLAAPPGAD